MTALALVPVPLVLGYPPQRSDLFSYVIVFVLSSLGFGALKCPSLCVSVFLFLGSEFRSVGCLHFIKLFVLEIYLTGKR